MSSSDDLLTFVSAIRDNRLLDANELTHLDTLQSRCSEPKELAQQLLERGSLTRFQTEQLFRGDGEKLVLGQYILLEPLGEGGMGMVYKAKHLRMKRVVALKVIRTDSNTGSFALKRFEQEIEAAAALQHPNIVIAYDANEVDSTLFFVMEYVEGIDLGKLVQRFGRVPLGNACDYISQAARGLQHAMERGLIHRDIKPSNLLLSFHDSVVKILDMGLARLKEKEEKGGLTFTGMVMGTPDFISPEQAKNSRLADIRSDIYSLGCAFYYLLAGRVPYFEGSFTEKLLKHSLEDPTPLEELVPDVPAGVHAVIKKMMMKKPEERYQTPIEIVADLAAFATPEKNAERFRPSKKEQEEKDAEWVGKVVSQSDVTLERPGPGSALEAAVAKSGKKVSSSDSGTQRLSAPSLAPSRSAAMAPDAASWQTLPPPAPKKGQTHSKTTMTAEAPQLDAEAPPAPRAAQPAAMRGVIAVVTGIGLALLAVVGYKFATGGFGPVAVVTVPLTAPTTASIPPTKPAATEPVKPPETKITPPDTKVVKPPSTKPETPVKAELLQGIIAQMPPKDPKSKDELETAISRDGRWLVGGWGTILRRWDLSKSKPDTPADALLETWPIHANDVAPDGRVLIGTNDEERLPGKAPRIIPVVAMWDPNTKDPPRTFRGHEKEISAVAFSRDGNRAISGSEDRTVRLWDLLDAKNTPVKTLKGHDGKVLAVAISPSGDYALSGGRDNKVILWNLEKGTIEHTFPGHTNFVTAVAFSPNGKYALSAGYDSQVILWDLEKRTRVRAYSPHTGVVWTVAFAPDSAHFLSGGSDQIVHVYSVDAAGSQGRFEASKGRILSVGVSADGQYGLTVDDANKAWRWELPKSKMPD